MESVLKPPKPRCGLTGNGNSIVTHRGFHRNCMSFLMKKSHFKQRWFQHYWYDRNAKSDFICPLYRPLKCICTEKICRESRHFQFICSWCWSKCDVTSGTLAMPAIVRLFVDSQRLIARSQNRTKCVKYVGLSYPTWPSRWVLCISMQWLRLKGCHVAWDEWTSREICSLQPMWVIGSVMWAAASDESLKFGVQGATATNWFSRVNGARDSGIWLYLQTNC